MVNPNHNKSREELLTLYNIIRSYLGEISVTGSDSEDEERYKNLLDYEFIICGLLGDIEKNLKYKDDPRASMKKIGQESARFFYQTKLFTEE